MLRKRTISVFLVSLFLCAGIMGIASLSAWALTDMEQLGKSIFFDNNLSINNNQACAVCHAPEVGFTGPDGYINMHGAVYEGSIMSRFGNRKPPASAYATQSPILYQSSNGVFVGGNFWDGRATGEKLGNPAADQAQGPFLNPLEQGLPDKACVVYRVCSAMYPVTFQQVWPGACAITWPMDIETGCAMEGYMPLFDPENEMKVSMAYDQIALSIASYEASPEVNAFSSKYDAVVAGMDKFSKKEQAGFNLFWGKGKCNKCHTVNPRGKPALFTDYTYDNLGVPRNPENPFYTELEFNPLGAAWIDFGLGGFLQSRMDYSMYARENFGKQKVPTLRNVAKGSCEAGYDPCIVKAYSHNGYFKSLKGIVHFYNTRDVLQVCPGPYTETMAMAENCWPLPELALNMNTKELGNLGMSNKEEDELVEFLKTLSDGYTPPAQ